VCVVERLTDDKVHSWVHLSIYLLDSCIFHGAAEVKAAAAESRAGIPGDETGEGELSGAVFAATTATAAAPMLTSNHNEQSYGKALAVMSLLLLLLLLLSPPCWPLPPHPPHHHHLRKVVQATLSPYIYCIYSFTIHLAGTVHVNQHFGSRLN